MRQIAFAFLVVLIAVSCKKPFEPTTVETDVFRTKLTLKASATRIFIGEKGLTRLSAFDEWDNDLTAETRFEIDGQPLAGNVFKPEKTGAFEVRAFFKKLASPPLVVAAQNTGRRKVLLEYFTTQTCGWCPYAGFRVDSLQRAERDLVTVSVHGNGDELSTPHSLPYEKMLSVTGRPMVFANRKFVDPATFREFKNIADTALAMLAVPSEVGIALDTHFSGDFLAVKARLQAFDAVSDSLFFTLLLLEDGVISSFQSNYFSDTNLATPFAGQPNPILNFENHRVLRQSATEVEGLFIGSKTAKNEEFEAGNWMLDLTGLQKNRLAVVGICHRKKRPDQFLLASVINAQQVAAGSSVGFDE